MAISSFVCSVRLHPLLSAAPCQCSTSHRTDISVNEGLHPYEHVYRWSVLSGWGVSIIM